MEPLPSKLRPKSLEEFAGQTHVVGPGNPSVGLRAGPLRKAIEEKMLFSFLLWGPPGVGKTTLARIYANEVDADMYELSAVSAGKADIKKIADEPKTLMSRPKILFLDEIHRFNKAQQDYLLPFVESGEITLIGATTENPSFEVIPALLSRCKVFVLKELAPEDMKKILDRTGIKMKPDARKWLIAMANGDARQALSMIENTQKLYGKVTLETLKETLQSSHLRYDKKGEEHYNTISAFIKSMRASQPDAAMYYLARMLEAGEDPIFIARRLVIFASEDVGLAQPTALVVANAVFRAVETVGLPEARINLAHGVAYLSNAPKDKSAYNAIGEALEDARTHGNLPVPMKIRNAPTKLMKDMGYGEGYDLYTKEDLMPEELKGRKYFRESKKEDGKK